MQEGEVTLEAGNDGDEWTQLAMAEGTLEGS